MNEDTANILLFTARWMLAVTILFIVIAAVQRIEAPPETYIGTPIRCELIEGTDIVHCEETPE